MKMKTKVKVKVQDVSTRQSSWELTRSHGVRVYDRYDPLQLAVVATGVWRRSISEGAYTLYHKVLKRKE